MATLSDSRNAPSGPPEDDRTTLIPEAPSSDDRPTDRAITVRGPLVQVEAAFRRRDFADAVEMADEVLRQDPMNEAVRTIGASARLRLRHSYLARLGSVARVPHLRVGRTEVATLDITPNAAFLVALVDGVTTVGEMIDMAPLPEHETLALLLGLIDGGVLTI